MAAVHVHPTNQSMEGSVFSIDSKTKVTNLTQLPNDILLQILDKINFRTSSDLLNIRLICKRLHQVANEPRFWQKLSLGTRCNYHCQNVQHGQNHYLSHRNIAAGCFKRIKLEMEKNSAFCEDFPAEVDGNFIYVLLKDMGKVDKYSIEKKKKIQSFECEAKDQIVTFSAKNDYFAFITEKKVISVWGKDSKTPFIISSLEQSLNKYNRSFQLYNDSIFIIAANGIVKMWDIQTQKCIQEFHDENEKGPLLAVFIYSDQLFAISLKSILHWDINSRLIMKCHSLLNEKIIKKTDKILDIQLKRGNLLCFTIKTENDSTIIRIWDIGLSRLTFPFNYHENVPFEIGPNNEIFHRSPSLLPNLIFKSTKGKAEKFVFSSAIAESFPDLHLNFLSFTIVHNYLAIAIQEVSDDANSCHPFLRFYHIQTKEGIFTYYNIPFEVKNLTFKDQKLVLLSRYKICVLDFASSYEENLVQFLSHPKKFNFHFFALPDWIKGAVCLHLFALKSEKSKKLQKIKNVQKQLKIGKNIIQKHPRDNRLDIEKAVHKYLTQCFIEPLKLGFASQGT